MTAAAPVRSRPRGAPTPGRGRIPPARHLRVAPDLARRRRQTRLAVALGAAVSVLAVFALVSFHVLAVQHAFSLDRLTDERIAQERRYERLRNEVATLSSPAAVVEAAERLGMVPAESVDYIEAPPAAGRPAADARTSETLVTTHSEAKSSLGP